MYFEKTVPDVSDGMKAVPIKEPILALINFLFPMPVNYCLMLKRFIASVDTRWPMLPSAFSQIFYLESFVKGGLTMLSRIRQNFIASTKRV
jgi:hypothetical protein